MKGRRAYKAGMTALFIVLGVVLAELVAILGVKGISILPLHYPVLLAGFLLGPIPGAVCGLVCPPLIFLLEGGVIPWAYAAVPLMMLELATYGLTAGLFKYKMRFPIYTALVVSMLCGRIVYALAFCITVHGFEVLPPTSHSVFQIIAMGLPGIVIQLLALPPIESILEKKIRGRP